MVVKTIIFRRQVPTRWYGTRAVLKYVSVHTIYTHTDYVMIIRAFVK